jgi:GntR family transcriptional regulator
VTGMATPLHARVSDRIRRQILSGEIPVGTTLPSEARLSATFNASRGTIRAALATLRHEGVIEGGQGRPPVVRDNAAPQPFETFMSFTAWALQIGRVPGQRTIEVARRGASATAAEALELEEGVPVIDVLRLRTLDGAPAMLERASFVERVGRHLFDFDPDHGSIYAHLAELGVAPERARHTFDAVSATDTDAEHLDLPLGAPLLRERRRSVDGDGVPIEYGDDRYRSDRVTFSIDNVQPTSAGISRDLRILKETS